SALNSSADAYDKHGMDQSKELSGQCTNHKHAHKQLSHQDAMAIVQWMRLHLEELGMVTLLRVLEEDKEEEGVSKDEKKKMAKDVNREKQETI
ncbi:unnamed protein product, partial [Sphenostylis stenocarpa]